MLTVLEQGYVKPEWSMLVRVPEDEKVDSQPGTTEAALLRTWHPSRAPSAGKSAELASPPGLAVSWHSVNACRVNTGGTALSQWNTMGLLLDWDEDVGRGGKKAEEADIVRLRRVKQGVRDLSQQGALVGICPEGDIVETVFGGKITQGGMEKT